MIEDVFFNDKNLNDIVNAELYFHEFNEFPERDIKKFPLARANRTVVTAAHFVSKQITINFNMRGCDHCSSECALGHLKALTQCKNGTLGVLQCFPTDLQTSAITGNSDISDDYTDCVSQLIEYKDATLQELNLDWFGVVARVTATFFVGDPIGYGVIPITVRETLYTASPTVLELFIPEGTFIDQEPIITINYSTNSSPVGGAVVGVIANGNELSIPVAGLPQLVIDSSKGITTNFGGIINTSGVLPVFKPGENKLTIVDNYSTRTATIEVSYVPRYL